jgi:Cu(I)/Ag(I) efflux system protein CusF
MKGTTVMKEAQRFALAAVLASSFAAVTPSYAQMGGMDMKDMDMGKDAGKKSASKTHKGVGTVKKIDSAGGKVTIAHGPIKTMNWPAMNMTFTVKDKKALEKLEPEKKVEFQFIQQGSDYIITSIK